ncbi:hypothetical protein OAJ53_02385 [Pelagibacteraceae bacterium]|nr:hypothetical protein [Pelagibacteraceae bacterium]
MTLNFGQANNTSHQIHKIAICDLDGKCSRLSNNGRIRILD